MQPKLHYSCSEPWDNMRITMLGRHCVQCDKQVVDFTGGTKLDLIAYLRANQGSSICGRVRHDQVDAYQEMMEVLIHRTLRYNRRYNLAFYLLAVTGISLQACGDPHVELTDDSMWVNIGPSDTTTNKKEHEPEKGAVVAPETELVKEFRDTPMLMGDISLEFDPNRNSIPLIGYPEGLPEFPGGQDSLFQFLKKRVAYPDWEAARKIHGRVMVKFTVLEDGTVTDPIVVRSVEGSRNFDAEVLRVMALMPKWKPGETHGKPVRSTFVLPFHFSLNAG